MRTYEYDDYMDEKPRKQKAKISKRKAPAKSKHKHDYEPVMFVYRYNVTGNDYYSAGSRCRICEKLRHGWPADIAAEFEDFNASGIWKKDLIKEFGDNHKLDTVRLENLVELVTA